MLITIIFKIFLRAFFNFFRNFRFIFYPVILLNNVIFALFLSCLIVLRKLFLILNSITKLILLIPIKIVFLFLFEFILLFSLKCYNLILIVELIIALIINIIRNRGFRRKFLNTWIIIRFHLLRISFELKEIV
jgi:hypothetical protein